MSDKRSVTSALNGVRSNGAKTAEGLYANALARVKHGALSWTPVLPGECEEDWAELRDGINADWQPVGTTEGELTLCLSMAFWQRRRLYRHEKDAIIRAAREDAASPFLDPESDESADLEYAAWNGGQAALRHEIAGFETVLAMLPMLDHEPDTFPIHNGDAEVLLAHILKSVVKGVTPLPLFTEPVTGWTVGDIRELTNELASDCGKPPAAILKAADKHARSKLTQLQHALDQVLHHVQAASVLAGYQNHDAARLWDYDRRTFNTVVKTINALERRQAIRRGEPVASPAALDVTVTHSN